MTSKENQPATPLPWIYDAERQPATPICTADRREWIASPFRRVGEEQDARYIAHACNAYPRLVEALRGATEHAALYTGDGARGEFPAFTLNEHGEVSAERVVTFCRAILRDLGEIK